MPSRARAWLGTAARSASWKRTLPPPGLRIPMMVFMSVVLPAPLRPMRPIIEPVGKSKETPRRICTAAIDTLRFSTLSTLADDVAFHIHIGEGLRGRRVGDDAAVVEGN